MSTYITSFSKELIESFSFADKELKDFNSNDFEYVQCDVIDVDLDLVVGTDHCDYVGKSWGELIQQDDAPYQTMKRSKSALQDLKRNPDYYLNEKEKHSWGFSCLNGEYYISGGNHRTVLAKAFFEANNLPPIIKGASVSYYRNKMDAQFIAASLSNYSSDKSKVTNFLKSSDFIVGLAIFTLGVMIFR